MRIPQITSVRVCTCAMARIVETQRPLFPLQFLNLSLCRPHCTQFTDGQLKDSFDHFSTGSWLKRSTPDSFRESFSWHLHHFPCQHASDRLNKQDRSLLCIRAAPSTVVHWCWEHWERPPFPSKVVIHSPRILMFGNSWISTGRWEKHGETRNSHEINITQPWRVESLSFFSSFFMLFFAKKIERSPASNRSILCGLPKIDHALLWLSGGTGSDTSTWSYYSWWLLYPRHLIYPDSVYVLALWMQFQVSSGILALVPPSLA